MATSRIEPFRIAIPEQDLADLRARLARTRWPSELPEMGWTRGVPGDYLRALVEHWRTTYDWRAHEAAFNALPQFVTRIDGARVHFLHVRSPRPDATPLLLLHGWPGSIAEMTKLIAPLTEGSPAFHVIVPSLPGFGFSGPTSEAGWNVTRMAHAMIELMRRLGYTRYAIHGGDTGSMVAREMGVHDAAHVSAVHVLQVFSFGAVIEPRDAYEQRSVDAQARYESELSAYMHVQSQIPQTLAYALADSPVGQLAWIVDIFKRWTDNVERPEEAVDRDQLLTNASIYWLTNTAGSSAQVYAEAAAAWGEPARCEVPMGVAVFPRDAYLTVRRVAEEANHVTRFTVMERGGHFAAMEQPELLVAELRAFFAAHR